MFKDKTFEEIVAIMNTLSPEKLKHFYDLAQKIDTDDDKLYSKSNIEININANTPKKSLTYNKKIGYTLHDEIRDMQLRRGQTILMESNAGSGKTYSHLKVSSELDLEDESSNTVYVFSVPNSKQSNQNEVGDDLWEFGFVSVVGKKNKLKTDDGEHYIKKLKKGHRKFSCVYDLTHDVVQSAKDMGLEVVLLVDEAHKLVSKFRHEAIQGIEEAMKLADMRIMITATPDKCMMRFKYDEIFELTDSNPQYNIKNFEIVYTDMWQATLRRKIAKACKLGQRPLVNLSVKLEDIDALAEALRKDGYIVEVASSVNAKSKVFEEIVATGTIPKGIDIVLCTSAIEVGISIKSQDIVPMMVSTDAFKFNSDNVIQFFARPRKSVKKGILILKNKFEDAQKVLYDVKKTGKNDEFKKVYNLDYYMNRVNAEANEIKISMARDLKELTDMYGVRTAIDHIKDRIIREFKYTHSLVIFDEYALDFYIDNIAVINRACQLRDMALITGGILELQTFFIGKIFYEKLSIKYDNLQSVDEAQMKKLRKSIKEEKNIKQKHKLIKEAQEERFREYFKDEEFLRLLPKLAANKLDVLNIKEYNTKITFKELMAFKRSPLFNIVVKASVHLTIDEIAKMVTSRYYGNEEYISLSDMEKICTTSSNVTQNKIGSHNNDKSAYNVLTNIIDDLKTKGGKKAPERIMLSKKIMIMLYSELVRTNHYQGKKIKEILKDAPPKKKFNYKNYYTDKKISTLEKALIGKDGRIKPASQDKLIREIERIYNINTYEVKGSSYLYIVDKLAKFDFDKHLNDALSCK